MVKLNKHVENLEETIVKIENKVEALRDKYIGIEEKAWHEGREMTWREHEKRSKIEEQIEELEEEASQIEFALDFLRGYVE